VLILNSENVYLYGFTVQNSPSWTIHPIYSSNLTTQGVSIKTSGYGVENCDGWDPDSSTDCYLFDTTFDTHDDSIAIKSGANADGLRVGRPSRNIRISDSSFPYGGGLALGSEMSGGIENVNVYDCNFARADRGIHIKTRRGRGGYVRNVHMRDITF